MKKLLALVLALSLLCVSFAAMAAEYELEDIGLTITIPDDYEEESLSESDMADGLVAFFYNDNLEVSIYLEDSDGYSIQDVLNDYAAAGTMLQSGTTTINGVDYGYAAYNDSYEGEAYICIDYFTVISDTLFTVSFSMTDGSASTLAKNIMETIH